MAWEDLRSYDLGNGRKTLGVGNRVLRSVADILGADELIASFQALGGKRRILSTNESDSVLSVLITRHNQVSSWNHASCIWHETAVVGQALLVLEDVNEAGAFLTLGLLFEHCAIEAREAVQRHVQSHRSLLIAAISSSAELRERGERLQACHETIDAVDMGVVHVDANGTIIFENCVASAMLDSGDGIRRSGAGMAACDLGDAVRLRVAIEHTLKSAHLKQSAPIVALRKFNKVRSLFAAVVATQPQQRRIGMTIVYLFDPDRDCGQHIATACRLYALTPVEISLTSKLVAGLSLSEAAGELRIKEATARSYLKQVFLKTGVNRQATLMKLILSSTINLNPEIEAVLV